MAKEKQFRDGKRSRKKKKKGLTKRQRREAARLKEKGLLSVLSPSKKKKGKKKKKTALKKKKKKSSWSEINWVEWNRRQTTGVSIDDLTTNVSITEEETFLIVETNLDVDLALVENRRLEKKRRKLTNLLSRSNLNV